VFQNPHGPAFTLRTEPWVVVSVNGVLTNVLDLTNRGIQLQLGTNLTELTGEWRLTQSRGQTAPTQLLGHAAYETGRILALLYVSAKNPIHGRGLAVFSDRLAPGGASYLEVIDPHRNLSQRFPPSD
jgi:hypothetical protein